MKLRFIIPVLWLILMISGCHRLRYKVENTLRHLSESVESRMPRYSKEEHAFSIRNVVADFRVDTSIHEINSLLVDGPIFYTGYAVYTGPKARILSGINNISVDTTQVADKCTIIDRVKFDKSISTSGRTGKTAFFWHFETLMGYEIYTCVKMPFRHYIIFDTHSDTVYHRLEELRE